MTKTTQNEVQLHDLLSTMQQEEHDDALPDPTIRSNIKKSSKDPRAPTSLWEELQGVLKFYREKNP